MKKNIADSDTLRLFKAGHAVSFISKRTGFSQRAVRAYLRAKGEEPPPRSVKSTSTMNESTKVPEGDPLLRALMQHHGDRIKNNVNHEKT